MADMMADMHGTTTEASLSEFKVGDPVVMTAGPRRGEVGHIASVSEWTTVVFSDGSALPCDDDVLTRAAEVPLSEVWVLEQVLDHEPGWIEGIFTSAEKAKAAAPDASWALERDGRTWYQTDIPRFSPMLTITPHALDPEARS